MLRLYSRLEALPLDLPMLHYAAFALGLMLVLSGCARSDVAQPEELQHATPWERARLRGVDFRAIGQEPGWSLDIMDGDSITFVTGYGQTRVTTPAPEPTVDANAGRTTYDIETEAHEMTIVLTQEPCEDTMSGERFDTSVTVTLDGVEHQGCGRSLR